MRLLTAAAVLLVSASSAWAQDEILGARVREWYASLHGELSASTSSLGGTSIDVAHDLGLDKSEWSTEIQVYGHIPFVGKLYAGWWSIDRKADETLSRTIDFAGQTFTASTQISSEVKLDVGYLTYEWDFPTIPLGVGKLEIGLEVGARVLRGWGSIETAGGSGSDSGIIGTPVLGGHVALQLTQFVRADVELVGLEVNVGGHRASYLEGYGEIVAEPVRWVFAGVGYKYVALGVRDHTGGAVFNADVHLNGIYLTAGVRF
jgi:hypothetical protein